MSDKQPNIVAKYLASEHIARVKEHLLDFATENNCTIELVVEMLRMELLAKKGS